MTLDGNLWPGKNETPISISRDTLRNDLYLLVVVVLLLSRSSSTVESYGLSIGVRELQLSFGRGGERGNKEEAP